MYILIFRVILEGLELQEYFVEHKCLVQNYEDGEKNWYGVYPMYVVYGDI